MDEYINIYQIAREGTGITQERASDLLGISVESLRAYEGGRRIPPDRVVIKMVEIYDTKYLAYQHLKTSAEVGRLYLPNVKLKDLSTSILRLQKEFGDFYKFKDVLLDVTCDGVISSDEETKWAEIIKELDDVIEAILTVKFCRWRLRGEVQK